MNKKDLITFEKEVITQFKKGETYGPVHLSGGNEEQLIEIFKKIKPQDWVFSTHRSHFHALLKSNDPEWLMNEIIKEANSSHINSKKHKIFTSAIVGGNIPIALGTAFGIQLKQNNIEKEIKEQVEEGVKAAGFKLTKETIVEPQNLPHVYCFVGDMAAEMGCFIEALKYATNFDLPITFVIEDNELGCNTPTNEVWGRELQTKKQFFTKVIYYKYKRKYPHYGIGEWVTMSNELKTQGDYIAK